MIYYSNEARNTAITRIKELIPKIASIPGDVLSYSDASDTISYLGNLLNEIEKEAKSEYFKRISKHTNVR